MNFPHIIQMLLRIFKLRNGEKNVLKTSEMELTN